MLRAIINGVKDYQNALPVNIPREMFKSAFGSFVISVLFSKNYDTKGGSVAAALAATASLVDALTMPFFRRFLADRTGNIGWFENLGVRLVSLVLTQVLVEVAKPSFPVLQAYRIHLAATAIALSIIDLLMDKDKRSTHGALGYLVWI